MKREHYQYFLYLIDFGDYVKIGKATAFKYRFKHLCKQSGLKPNFEKSYVWKGVEKDIDAIEHLIRRKYKEQSIRTLIGSRETFVKETEKKIMYDIVQLRSIFPLELTEAIRISDMYDFEGYEGDAILIKSKRSKKTS